MMKFRSQLKCSATAPERVGAAFTLIELLVVIAIISVLAGLLFPAGAVASRKMKVSRVQAELNQLVTKIETYKLEVNEYPPDNGNLVNVSTNSTDDASYTNLTARSPLYYELTGAVFDRPGDTGKGVFKVSGGTETITPDDLRTHFNVDGIRNSSRTVGDIPYKNPGLKPSQYKELNVASDIELVVATVPGPFMLDGKPVGTGIPAKINPWHYDRTTQRRNNRQSFDLWVDIVIGKQTNRIANWRQK